MPARPMPRAPLPHWHTTHTPHPPRGHGPMGLARFLPACTMPPPTHGPSANVAWGGSGMRGPWLMGHGAGGRSGHRTRRTSYRWRDASPPSHRTRSGRGRHAALRTWAGGWVWRHTLHAGPGGTRAPHHIEGRRALGRRPPLVVRRTWRPIAVLSRPHSMGWASGRHPCPRSCVPLSREVIHPSLITPPRRAPVTDTPTTEVCMVPVTPPLRCPDPLLR